MRAIVLAGGLGTRLRPHTEMTPKPLLPLAGMPLLDIILLQLKGFGFDHVTLALYYRAEQIRLHAGDGSRYGLEIDYSVADRLLGTAGPLALVPRPAASCLVLNADLLTDIDFAAVMAHHRSHGLAATVVLCRYSFEVPFGVVEVGSDDRIQRYREKPVVETLINAGIYVLEPVAWDKIPPGQHLDMPDLIARGIRKGHQITTYRHDGEWHDIGTVESYHRCQAIFAESRDRYLPFVYSSLDPAAS
jgi:NDP-mannose synthase